MVKKISIRLRQVGAPAGKIEEMGRVLRRS
jgi:hypothetical protein